MTRREFKPLVVILFCFIITSSTISIAQAKTVIDETINVSALSYRYYYNSLEEGTNLRIEIEVTKGNDISFYIADSSNFAAWSKGKSSKAYIQKNDVVSTTIDWTVPKDGTFYFILDNLDSLTSTSVHLKVTTQILGAIGGIPGFPIEAIIVGCILSSTYLISKRSSNPKLKMRS